MKNLKRYLSLLLAVIMLTGVTPLHSLIPTVAAGSETLGENEQRLEQEKNAKASESEPLYEVKIVSFIRGPVADGELRCSELLEARIYKSTDGGTTWEVATDVDGVPVSKLSYTWTNTSENTDMVVFLSHDMTKVGLYGDTAEQTFRGGISSTAVGGQWAAYKTPGVSVGSVGGWPGMGGWPGFRPGGGSSSSTTTTFSGTVTVQVKLPDGDVIKDSCSRFKQPDLAADLNNIALGLFIGESKTLLELLGESALVHINCSTCSVSNVVLKNNDGCAELFNRNSAVRGVKMGEATLSMNVDKEGCTVHNGQNADVETKIFVFRKPETSTTTTTLTLEAGSLDDRCRYYINGVEGTKQSDGSILFTGLTPDTDYTVDVVATYSAQDDNSVVKYAYAYVTDTTMPVYTATVNTYLDGQKTDIADIHGEDVILYIKAENSAEYLYLSHTGTGTYSVGVDNGIYHVYHKEAGGFHKINENNLVIASRAGSVDVHHYSVTYDPAGGAFAGGTAPVAENFASGKKVTATSSVPTRDGYVFLGWSYDKAVVSPGATVTSAITAPVRLIALWEREVNVHVNVTIDHTYTDPNGNVVTDSNNDSKDDLTISLVARENASAPYLEVPGADLLISESSHSGHTLFVNGNAVANYAAAGTTDITRTEYEDSGDPTFSGLSAGKEYYVTVAKTDYSAVVTAEKQANGDWVIDVTLKFDPASEEIVFEVKMDRDVPAELYPEAVIVKVLYYNESSRTWELIAQHDNGNPGVRVPITGQSGNVGSFPVWVVESGETKPYYYRMMISAFIYQDGTIVPSEEAEAYLVYTDKNFTATMGGVSGGQDFGGLKGAYFSGGAQKGTLDAVVTLEAYDVTFVAEGGKINGDDSMVLREQYYIPDFSQNVPTMAGHTFLGWWYKDANGNYTVKATDGELLTSDITLYALWDQTLEGQVTVNGTYQKGGETLTVWDADRATQAMVILQEITSDTVNNLQVVYVPITWSADVGTSSAYKFVGLDPMKNYRIEVIVTNYEATYQNSTTPVGTYEADDYQAIYTEAKPWETFVNGKLSFVPEGYLQSVEVDASQIGESFRPGFVMTQIWYTERGSGDPYKVITQHKTGGLKVLIGSDGKQNGTYAEEVWVEKFNGNLYDYQAYVSDEAVRQLPVTITYGAHSNYDTVSGKARNPLTVTLVPNRYDVTLDLNTGSADDLYTYYEAHAWSHETPVTATPTRAGYVFVGWKATKNGVFADGKILASTHEAVTLVAQWERATINYTVEYYYDGELKKTDTSGALFEAVINPAFQEKVVFSGKNYALDYVVGAPLTIGVNEAENLIKVYYGTDNLSDDGDSTNTPDGIPDHYQATVIFEIVNGTWDANGTAESITRVFTLYTKNPDRPWTKVNPAPAMGTLPEGTANVGFVDVGSWSPAVPAVVERNATYTLAFNHVSEYSVTVIVVNGTVTVTGLNETFASHVYTVTHGADLALSFAPDADFALDRIAVDGVSTTANGIDLAGWNAHSFNNVTENHTIRVVYSADTVGGGADGDEPDNVPDKYQKKVTFKVVNGTWNGTDRADKVCYVTLKTDGKWDENGTAAHPAVPSGMTPDANFKKGAWDVSEFPRQLRGTESVTYTHTFKPIAYLDFVYTVEHYKQQSNGIFVLAEREEVTIPDVELNAEENGFENAVPAVNAVPKNYGQHYREDTAHGDRVAQGTPIFGQSLTLKLYYALDSHTVQYDLNGGSAAQSDYSAATYLCGSTATVKEAVHKNGYLFQGWKAEDGTVYQVGDKIVVDEDIVLTAQWQKRTDLSYTVYYLEENTNQVLKPATVVNNMAFGDVVNSLSHKANIDDYLFVSASPESLTIDVDSAKNVIILSYTLDTVGGGADGEDPDNVPDKYQKKVTFKVINGQWNDGTEAEKVVYVTLTAGGKWDENGTASLSAPAVGNKPNANFQAGSWDTTPPQSVSGTDSLEFTYTYARSTTPLVPGENVLYIVEHYKADNGTYPSTPNDVERFSGKIGATVTAVAKDYDGYCVNLQAAGTVREATLKALATDADIVILKLYYDVDTVGGGADGEDPDNVPDKYQKKVTFKVVNGTWKDGKEEDRIHTLTLMTDGKWDENGTATLETEIGMIADEGHGNGTWDVTPPTAFSGTEDAVFVFSFVKLETPPQTGDGSNFGLWLALLLLSGVGMADLIFFDRKRKAN